MEKALEELRMAEDEHRAAVDIETEARRNTLRARSRLEAAQRALDMEYVIACENAPAGTPWAVE